MLYLDYGRREGEWVPNQYGGNENLDAVAFLKDCNAELYAEHPDIVTIAEESTAWPGVSRPAYTGGLGFGMKWDMGWMHDTLSYFARDPVHRSHHHNQLTFRGMYAFSENFVLALSHDEVVHGKGSLLGKMPGDEWQKFANLRLLYAQMWSQPGKKLLFMGCEFGQPSEWNHDAQLEWGLISADGPHAKLQLLVGELNRMYREIPALHLGDAHQGGFEWVIASDAANSVFCYLRKGLDDRPVLVVLNATPVVRHNYRVGVDHGSVWEEILNTDAEAFGGSGQGNAGRVEASPVPAHERRFSLSLTLPPLSAVYLRPS
jgi:1,4-alpha-glucan branching enzyme